MILILNNEINDMILILNSEINDMILILNSEISDMNFNPIVRLMICF